MESQARWTGRSKPKIGRSPTVLAEGPTRLAPQVTDYFGMEALVSGIGLLIGIVLIAGILLRVFVR
jgi:hypothetical protein